MLQDAALPRVQIGTFLIDLIPEPNWHNQFDLRLMSDLHVCSYAGCIYSGSRFVHRLHSR